MLGNSTTVGFLKFLDYEKIKNPSACNGIAD